MFICYLPRFVQRKRHGNEIAIQHNQIISNKRTRKNTQLHAY